MWCSEDDEEFEDDELEDSEFKDDEFGASEFAEVDDDEDDEEDDDWLMDLDGEAPSRGTRPEPDEDIPF